MAWYSNLAWLLAQAAPAADKVAEKAAEAAADAADGDGMTGLVRLFIALGVVVGSFALGAAIARGLRMKDYSFRIGLVLFTLFAGLAITYFGWPPKRGIDLSGGVVLVYEVDTTAARNDWMQSAMAQINEQLDAAGGERLEVRPIGERQIEFVVPAGVEVGAIEKKIDAMRETIDVRLNPESRHPSGDATVLVYRAEPPADRALDMAKLVTAIGRRINPGGVKELTIRQYGAEQIEVIIPEVEEREVEQIKKKISTSGLLNFRIVANQTDDRELIKAAHATTGRDVYIGGRLEGRWVKAGPELPQTLPPPIATYRPGPGDSQEILVRIDPFNVDGRYLTRAAAGTDQKGSLAVDFAFDAEGAEKFRQLTKRNLPDQATRLERHLGIILDNEMLSAPTIQTTISNRGQIHGSFTKDYVDFLVGVLNAGSLPASLRPEPISEQRISAQLGDDTIRAGANATLISTAAILVFMLIYYRFAGVVADIAVTLNLLLTVALMILIKAAFTLPGLAGIVLTVGMAVDANVLIYERIREESERGASLRMAIRNGFSRAMSTIIDSNVTTLITAVVLYIIGTDQIKGFAVTLILGLLVSMFTAIYVARVIFDIAERKRWITSLTMMKIVGETHLDFIRWRNVAIVTSLVIMAVGVVAGTMRGKELLDIDFTGGSSVQVVFDDGHAQQISAVREAVAELPDVAVSSVGEDGLNFKVDTSDGDVAHVQSVLQKAFTGSLKTYSMTYGELAKIEAENPPAAEAKPDEAAAQTPEAQTPEAQTPEAQTPEAQTPAAQTPAAQTPAAQTPAATTPEAATPETKAPETKAPEQPAAETPPAEQPAAATPEAAPGETPAADGAPAPEQSSARAARSPFRLASYLQEPKSEEAPAETPAGESAPTESPSAESTPAESAPAETPPAADNPVADAPPAEKAEVDAEPAGSQTVSPTQLAADGPTGPVSYVGGTRVELTFSEPISHDPLRDMVQQRLDATGQKEAGFELANPAYEFGSEARYEKWTLRTTLDEAQTRTLLDAIQAKLADTPVFPSSSQIGGKVAGDTQIMALYAILASLVMIVIYVWIRFQNVIFGLAAVVAVLHDALIAISFLAMSYYLAPFTEALLIDPFKISLAVVAALLTIIGFSINDTIVIFDRIREVRGKSPDLTAGMINLSINQTLSRTLLTSGTVLIASIILYIVGGPGIHAFAFTMVVGVIAGTYSTVYIAAPILLWLRRSEPTSPTSGKTATTATAGRS